MQKCSFSPLFLALFIVQGVLAQISLQKEVDQFAELPENKFASVSICIIDLDKDSILANFNGEKSLMCASTAKLFSTYTALEVLGSKYRPQTRIYKNGTVDSLGVLQGDLYIQGWGDMSLGSKYFCEEGDELKFMSIWLKAIREKGIRAISGSVIADGSSFGYAGVPDGWDWSDMGNYYGAGASGINFFDNTVKYYFDTYGAGKKAKFIKTFPSDSHLVFRHQIKAANIRNDQSYLFGAPYSTDRYGVGCLPSNRSSFVVKGSMPDPEYMLAKEFTRYLREDSLFGLVTGEPKGMRLMLEKDIDYDELDLVCVHKGETIIDIVRLTNMKSINLFAEGLLNLVGLKNSGNGSTKSGIEQVYVNLKGKVNVPGMRLQDGSGLSRKNAVSAMNFCDLLSYIDKSEIAELFKSSLSVAGESGTLKNICKGQSASGLMKAKSGTLSNVKAYAGYIESKLGANLAFALIVNNFQGTSYQMVRKMERIFNTMANY